MIEGFGSGSIHLTRRSGSGYRRPKKHGSDGSGFGSATLVKILNFFDADPGWKTFGSGIRDGKNSDPGRKKFGFGMEKFGSGINIPDPQH
jgi:hypothetical protein